MGRTDLGDRIAHLPPEKRALLEHQLQRRAAAAADEQAIPARGATGASPLSFGQERLWFLHHLEHDAAIYNIALAARMSEAPNVAALRRALDALVERHPILRTVFATVDGRPVQVVAEPCSTALALVDLSDRPSAEREGAAQQFIADEARRPFDLERGPLLRSTLIRLDDREHVFLVTMHHIVSDGWSLGILHRELTELYLAFSAGHEPALAPLPVQYADFAAWQREWLQGERLEALLGYWRTQLAGAPLVVELPADRPRPRTPTYRGAGVGMLWSPELARGLTALSQREGVTLFMTLLAAFGVLLHRYTGLDDLLIGSPIAGRNRREVEGLIGFFVNTLALRVDLRGDPTFRELLRRVRETTLGAYAHQDLPFEKLVEALQPERDRSRQPVVQVMFAFQNLPEEAAVRTHLLRSGVDTGTAKFDLTLYITETLQGLEGWFEYSTDLFDPDTIQRLAGHFTTLVEGLVADPDSSLSRCPLLTAAERQQVVIDWNDTAAPFPADRGIDELFQAQVEQTPDRTAVVWGDERWSYRTLNARANQLAHYLQRRGLGPDVLVGLRLERSPELVVALLGILKAGGAYLPLDLAYPPARQAFMLRDGAAPVLITTSALRSEVLDYHGEVICLDRDEAAIAAESTENPHGGASGDHLAYVIYTSGSTGEPKGVAVPHRAVNRLVVNTDYVQLGPADVVAQVSNASFDAATFEIWGALLNGARLVILDKEVVLSARELRAAIERHGIGTMFLTTALFNQLVAEEPAVFAGLEQLLVGGEALDPVWIRAALQAGPPRRLLNAYGPTETTTFAATYHVEHVPTDATTIPIGRPIANTRLYVLDRHLTPCPIGVPGELYIGGPGVARGYLHRPALTAEKFVPDPFGVERNGCLYRTGDRVRLLHDGNIEFLGRIDQQVKLRGFRIELGEIEAVLCQHPGVQQAVVVVHESAEAGKRLVAYVVPHDPAAAIVEALPQFLRQELPAYMVPAVFTPLAALPLNANGKLDRAALPPPGHVGAPERGTNARPRTEVQARLTRIWQALLGVPAVRVDDDFFDLGGHSLLVMRLLTEIEKEFGQRPPLSTIFPQATIEGLAAWLCDPKRQRAGSVLVPIQPEGQRPPLFCVHPLGGDVLCYHNLARHLGLDQPVYGLQAPGLDGLAEPLTDIPAIAAHYIEQVRTVQPSGSYHLLGFSSGGTVVFEMAQQLHRDGCAIGMLGILDHPVTQSNYYRPRFRLDHWLTCVRDLWAYTDKLNRLSKLNRLRPRHLCRLIPAQRRPRSAREEDNPAVAEAKIRAELDAVVAYVAGHIVGDVSELPEHHRLVIEAQYMALNTYVPQVYPGRITLFRARWQPILCSHDPTMGWGHLAAQGVEVCTVPGSHLSVLGDAYVAMLAEQLALHLAPAYETNQGAGAKESTRPPLEVVQLTS